jgi:hypothetical protein
MLPNGLRLSGARKGVRCSRGLDGAGFVVRGIVSLISTVVLVRVSIDMLRRRS